MQIKNLHASIITCLGLPLLFIGCVTMAPQTPPRVVNEPIVFEDKIVFLKPVVFKSGVEFRGSVEGRGAAHLSHQPARERRGEVVRLKPVPPAPVEERPVRRPQLPEGVPLAELSVLTYNVKMWSAGEGRRRLPHVERLLRRDKPDVVALQECGNWFFRTLTRRRWVQENYYVARPGGRARHVGGLVLLSRYPIENVEYKVLSRNPGQRSRYALVARLRVLDRKVTVANVHLESPLEKGELRARQMQDLLPMISGDPHTILLGDFNFGDGEPEERVVRDDFADLWTQLRPGDPGYTWDMERSWMARRFAYRGERSRRLDRILLRSADWKPTEVKLYGQHPVRGRSFASDHFGVLGRLALYDG